MGYLKSCLLISFQVRWWIISFFRIDGNGIFFLFNYFTFSKEKISTLDSFENERIERKKKERFVFILTSFKCELRSAKWTATSRFTNSTRQLFFHCFNYDSKGNLLFPRASMAAFTNLTVNLSKIISSNFHSLFNLT